MSNYPLVINSVQRLSGVSTIQQLPFHGSLGHLALDILDSEAGKEISILQYLIQTAKRSNCEDVILAVDSENAKLVSWVTNFVTKKKKLLTNVNLKVLEVAKTVQTQLDLIRTIEAQVGAASLAKGFYFVSSWVLPPRSLTKLAEFHISAAKKDSCTILTYWPVHLAVQSVTSLPSVRRLIVTDGKTSELLAAARFNQYEIETLDLASLIPLQGRWANPPEQINVRTDIKDTDLFFAGGDFLKLINENFDFATTSDVIENALAREVKMEGIYFYDKELPSFSKSQFATSKVPLPAEIRSLRALQEFCAFDSAVESDAIFNEGCRSHWKVAETNVVRHETAEIDVSCTLSDVLIFNGVSIGSNSILKDSIVVLEDAQIGKNCHLEKGIIVGANVSVPDNTELTGPGIIVDLACAGMVIRTDVPGIRGVISNKQLSDNALFISTPIDMLDEMPNSHWRNQVKNLTNDPSKDPDGLLDVLYEAGEDESLEEEEEAGDDNKEFSHECQAMLMSVVRIPEHLRNIELELRSYRLSAFKSDNLVLTSILPVLLATLVQLGPSDMEELQEFVDNSGVGDLFSAFFEDTQKGHLQVYGEIKRWLLETETMVSLKDGNEDPDERVPNPVFGDVAAFTKICAALDSEMDHSAYLEEWASTQPETFLKHPQMQKYIQWLREDDEESDD